MTPSLHWRVFFSMWSDDPIYHRPTHGANPFKTVCGRKIGHGLNLIPTKHARKIGKPCKSCFPGGDT